MRNKEITSEVINAFIEGQDPEERIVNVEYNYEDNFVTVIYRDELDRKCIRKDPYYPFIWATRKACLKLCDGNRDEIKRLLSKYGVECKPLDYHTSEGELSSGFEDGYLFLFRAKNPMSYKQFLSFFKEANNPVYSTDKGEKSATQSSSSKRQFLTVPPVEQYLIYTGKRFFKGYNDYNDLLRMIFDLETQGLDPTKDRIEWFGIRFNRAVTYNGKTRENYDVELQLEGKTREELDASELKMIDTAIRIIYTFRPDVITAHNGENFDWNFIIERCKQLGTSIEQVSSKYFNGRSIGKKERETVLKLGGEIEHFKQTIVPNIVVTDSLHAVRRAQAMDSNFLKADLKYSTKYLEMVKPNRVYIPGDKISETSNDFKQRYAFNNENGDWYIYNPDVEQQEITVKGTSDKKEKKFVIRVKNTLDPGYELVDGHYIVERYLKDDLWECDMVEYKLNTTNFLICKILPVPYQKCVTMGTAGQWRAVMMAWSYENGLAIPPFGESKAFTGGLSRLLKVGFVEDVIKLDYNSLYPSITLTWGIVTWKDLTHAMLHMLEYVLTEREKYKKEKKAAGKIVDKYEEGKIKNGEALTPEEGKEYAKAQADYGFNDKKQNQMKVLGNSFFGSYGAENVFPWGDRVCAERITCTGRQSLRLMISHFHNLGYEPIVGDTDGFNFKLPKTYRYTDENPYIGQGLSRETKKGEKYTGYKADVAEFNDVHMCDKHYSPNAVNKMGLGIDEVVSSTINFSRKNYADYFPTKPFPQDVKMVGNTIKSKKMPQYISLFLEKGIRLLLQNKGQEFLEEYYAYVEKIYNYQIPLKDIASKGKVKKYLDEYVKDCQTITKAGRPKSRQAWMELALKENLKVDLGETIYYINVGKTKSQADVKKVTHYFEYNENGERKDVITKIEKEYKAYKKDEKDRGVKNILTKEEYIEQNFPNVEKEEEIILNAVLLPRDIIESEDDIVCNDENGYEYNVPKYIEQFNKRITPLLVCFSKSIRDKILITNPNDRPYFTVEESQLTSGEPNKPGDQDTYEQLMTMEDKEIRFWKAHPEFKIPFLDECGMNWDEIVKDYDERQEREKQLGIDIVRAKYDEIINSLTKADIDNISEEGELPAELMKIVDIDPKTGDFVSKNYPDIIIGSMRDLFEENDVETSEE